MARPNDIAVLHEWILEQTAFDHLLEARIALIALKLTEFKFNADIDALKIVEICVRSVVQLAAQRATIDDESIKDVNQSPKMLSYIVELTAGICMNHPAGWEHFINNGFIWPQLSMAEVFNWLFAFPTNAQQQKQLIWFAGAIARMPTTPAVVQYLQSNNFVGALNVPVLQ